MDENVKILKRIYDGFNARDIDGVLNDLTADVRLGQRHGRWPRLWPRSHTRLLVTPMGHGQFAR